MSHNQSKCIRFTSLLSLLFLSLLLVGPNKASATQPLSSELTAADWVAIQSFLPSDYIKASNTDAGDQFGTSVAVSGNTVVVGAPSEASNGVDGQGDNSLTLAGAAYIFVRTGNTWSQQAYLKSEFPQQDALFGWDVAIDGDTVAISAMREDIALDNRAGVVYVFTRTGNDWNQQARLQASNAGHFDEFGASIALSGDTLVVGTPREDSDATGVGGNEDNNGATDAGAAYIFTRTGTDWSQQAYIKAFNTDAGDRFGHSVAIDGDTVIIGAWFEQSNATGVNSGGQADNSMSQAGAAYIFTRTGTVWSQQAYLKASNTGSGYRFGESVDISGDTVVVGSSNEASAATGVNGDDTDDSAPGAGAAYVFTRTGTVWSQQAYLKASNTDGDDRFSEYGVAIDGDTIVIGAFLEDSSATGINGNQADNSAENAGAAYVFTRAAEQWEQQLYLKASNTDAGDFFGSSVALDNGLIIIGAIDEASNATGINGDQDNNDAPGAGAVYIFSNCVRSAETGNWEVGSTWLDGVVPGVNDRVCIEDGHTVTMNGGAAIEQLGVFTGGTLDLSTHTLTVETSVSNAGTLRQTRTVDGNSIEFLHIQDEDGEVTQYRGVMLDASVNGGSNLGNVTVAVRELGVNEYCTANLENSDPYVKRCFDITTDNPPVNDVLLRLYARTGTSLNGIAPEELIVFRNFPEGGPNWVGLFDGLVRGAVDGGLYVYAEGDTPGFSAFLLGDPEFSPTAVTLHTLTAHSATNSLLIFIVIGLLMLAIIGLLARRAYSLNHIRR
jgi:hypothetical protein